VTYFRSRPTLLAALCMLIPFSCVAEQAAPESASEQSPVWISFQAPDSTGTYPQSINDLMVVTGYYTATFATRGFIREADGSTTTFAVPGASATVPVSINHAGDITGYYVLPPPSVDEPTFFSSVPQGFVRTADGTITTFGNTPNGLGDTHTTWFMPVAINDAGEVAGNEDNGAGSIVFVRSPSGSVEEFSLSAGPGVVNTTVAGINTSGAVVGYTQQGLDNWQGFLWSGSGALPSPSSNNTTTIIAAGSVQTNPTAMNAEGDIVGCYGKLGYSFDFVRNQEGTITTLNIPEEKGCDVTINDAGTIAGSYVNESYVDSVFIIPLHGEVSYFSYPGATNTWTTSLNNLDVITGYYTKGGTTQGFILIPAD
jgi:hypothetical protein